MKLRAFSFNSLFFGLFIVMFLVIVYMMFSHITELRTHTNDIDKGIQLSELGTGSDGSTESDQGVKGTSFKNKLPGRSEPVMLPVGKDRQVVNLQPAGSDHVDFSPRPPVSTLATRAPGDLYEEKSLGELDESLKGFYYSIHFGSFKNLSNAKARVERLTNKGLHAWWEKVNIVGKGECFRVFIGKQKTKAEALSLAEKLKAAGIIDDFYVQKLDLTE
jgi:hypothetical protein